MQRDLFNELSYRGFLGNFKIHKVTHQESRLELWHRQKLLLDKQNVFSQENLSLD